MAGLLGESERIREWCAFLVALIWLVHPAHNAAVAYISGRADSLAAVFALGAWLVWWKARDERRAVPRVMLCVCSVLLLLLAGAANAAVAAAPAASVAGADAEVDADAVAFGQLMQ